MKKRTLKNLLVASGSILLLPISLPLTVALLATVGGIVAIASPLIIVGLSIGASLMLQVWISKLFNSKQENENKERSWLYIISKTVLTLLLAIPAILPVSLAFAAFALLAGAMLLPIISLGAPFILLNELVKKASSFFNRAPQEEQENLSFSSERDQNDFIRGNPFMISYLRPVNPDPSSFPVIKIHNVEYPGSFIAEKNNSNISPDNNNNISPDNNNNISP